MREEAESIPEPGGGVVKEKLFPRRVVPLAATALLLSGCFHYRPVEPGVVPVGDEVRVLLTREGAAALPQEVPDLSGMAVRGKVMSREGDRLLLRVPVAVQREGLLTRELGRDVAIPSAQIVRVERRELSRGRTALAIAGGLGTAAALWASLGEGRSEGGSGRPEPPVEAVRIPLLSFPLP